MSETIDVAQLFSAYPSGRVPDDGKFNGETFRLKLLAPALRRVIDSGSGKLIVDIDGVRSFGSSFLEEAFAGLIRTGSFTREEVINRIEIRCTKEHLLFFKKTINTYINGAKSHVMSN